VVGVTAATEVEYTVVVNEPEKHMAHVEIVFKNVHETIILSKGGYHGYYPIPIYNFTATDGSHNLAVDHYFEGEGEWKKELWKIRGNYDNLKVSYDVKVGAVIRDHQHLGYIGKDFGVAMGEWFLLTPAKTIEHVKVRFILPESWKAYAPWNYQDGYFIPDDTEHLALSVVAFGDFESYSKKIGNTNVTIAVHKSINSKVRKNLASDAFRILEYQTELFGTSVYDRYLVVFTPKADDWLPIWGGEHAYSQGISFKDYTQTLRQFSHQAFHRWNGWAPLGMDSSDDDIKWIVEGIDVYYEDKILIDLGITEKFSETNLYKIYKKYYKDIAGTEDDMSVVEAGKYKTVTKSSAANFIIYRKGALVSMLLDFKIQEATNGTKSLNDVMKEMYRRYGGYKEKYTTSDFLEVVNSVSGTDLTDFFGKYVYGKEKLPLEEYFGDYDRDGVINIDEIRMGTDPEKSENVLTPKPTPLEYTQSSLHATQNPVSTLTPSAPATKETPSERFSSYSMPGFDIICAVVILCAAGMYIGKGK
jgi:predicted metalloprotease with PDZ domain